MLFLRCQGPKRKQPLSNEAQGALPGLRACLQPLWGCLQEQVCPQLPSPGGAPCWGCVHLVCKSGLCRTPRVALGLVLHLPPHRQFCCSGTICLGRRLQRGLGESGGFGHLCPGLFGLACGRVVPLLCLSSSPSDPEDLPQTHPCKRSGPVLNTQLVNEASF